MLDQSGDSIDPFDIYTEEEFLANQNILDSFGTRIEAKIKAKMEVGPSRHQSGSRKYINRNREDAHAQLMADYFDENPLYSDTIFRRRFHLKKACLFKNSECPRCLVFLFCSKDILY